MTAELGAAFTFTDTGGLAALRREAARDTPEARRIVAQQFEALFIDLMLRSMRGASEVDGGLVDGERLRFHQDMHDRQLALTLSQGRGIGLAESISRQLGGPGAEAAPPASGARVAPFAAVASRAEDGLARSVAGPGSAGTRLETPPSREDFVAAAWPHARRAARALGVSPDVLVAQAALESGWGRHMIRDRAGAPTFNVFGIKAGAGWSGRRVSVPTLEFVGGVPERRTESFRAYGSLAEAFDDYAALIGGQPRYRPAREARSPAEYARGLEAGGYSTDPRYAEKILGILAQGLPRTSAGTPGGGAAERASSVGTAGVSPARPAAPQAANVRADTVVEAQSPIAAGMGDGDES